MNTTTTTTDMGPSGPAPDVRGRSEADAIELMVQWFFDNFEDPAEETPFDDGDYVHIWGGPYDAGEELCAAFAGGISAAAIRTAVKRIESDGYDWARSASRMPEISDDPVIRAKQRLLKRIEVWCFEADETADPTATETAFRIDDVAVLLRAHHELQSRQRGGGNNV